MHRYIINRILLMIPTLLGVAIITFVLLRMVPGDIVLLKLAGDGGQVADGGARRQERAKLGLDKPMPQQFVDWILGAVRFDFGLSMWTGRPIVQEIAIRLELSLQLTIMASVIATAAGDPARRDCRRSSRTPGSTTPSGSSASPAWRSRLLARHHH